MSIYPVRPASQTPVKTLGLMLQWPLFLDGPSFIKAEGIADKIDADCKALDDDARWESIDPATEVIAPPKPELNTDEEKARAAAECAVENYQEYIYFHDFVQNFLYRTGKDAPFQLFRRTDLDKLEARVAGRDYTFDVKRLTVHMFRFGIAVMTLELRWDRADMQAAPWEMTLADAQQLINVLRRSDVPYWIGDQAQEVPDKVRLVGGNTTEHGPYKREELYNFFDTENVGTSRGATKILGQWKDMLAPLKLATDGGGWRDPSDERIPVSSYISLTSGYKVPESTEDDLQIENDRVEDLTKKKKAADEKKTEAKNRFRDLKDSDVDTNTKTDALAARREAEKDYIQASLETDLAVARADALSGAIKGNKISDADTLRQISHCDWARLAEADGPGATGSMTYNQGFIDALNKNRFYDRFFPDAQNSSATRYIFGGAHFCTIGAGWFFDNLTAKHWRRHYAQLSLITRFENAALLALSSRLSHAVAEADDAGAFDPDFRANVDDIQEQFLRFFHRYHFTGISSQIQPSEMHALFRQSLCQDELFDDVKAEIDSVWQVVQSQRQKDEADEAKRQTEYANTQAEAANRQAYEANRLAQIAMFGVVGGLIVGALGANVIFGFKSSEEALLAANEWSQLSQISLATALVLFISGLCLAAYQNGVDRDVRAGKAPNEVKGKYWPAGACIAISLFFALMAFFS